MSGKVRLVALYERVSSDDQRERETIKTQEDVLDRHVRTAEGVKVFRIYRDDGVSGTVPLAQRPEGRKLIADAMAGRFSEVWVTRPDRLGRDAVDRLQVFSLFENLEIKLVGVSETIGDEFMHGIHTIVDAHARRRFLAVSKEGMERAAREGRYCGGIVPFGYRVEGKKPHARLVPDDNILWSNKSAADIVRHIYRRLAIDGWPCNRAASELNDLGIPTAYRRDGRDVDGTPTKGVWYAGRIRNLIVEPVYKGVLCYGRRSIRRKKEDVITLQVPALALVSEDIWNAARATLAANRIIPKNTRRRYILRGLISCAVCGKRYVGTGGQRYYRYVCNGRHRDRRPPGQKECSNTNVRGPWFEEIVWGDIERALRNPGELIDELDAETSERSAAAILNAERTTLLAALSNLTQRRQRALALQTRGAITDIEFDALAAEIACERAGVEVRLREIDDQQTEPEMPADTWDILAEIAQRLDEGLDDATKREVAALLVSSITVHPPEAEAPPRIFIEYRFPRVVRTSRDTGSSRLQA